jgi:hypothetical protein
MADGLDFRELIEKRLVINSRIKPDAYYDLPGALASWVDKKGRRQVMVNTGDSSYWEFTLRGDLEAADIRILALQGLESISIKQGKLFIEVRK